jgi:predicted TPR repeat methyltransferase
MTRFRFVLLALTLLATESLYTVPSYAQDAKALRSQANSEPNQEKQVMLLCKAADLEPKNKEFRKDCDVSKAALINSDRQALKTAQDANDAGQAAKAKRYAKYVSSLDPDTHHQAEQLLAKLNAADAAPAAPAAPPAQAGQGALLAQALTAFDSGNLQAAKSTAQQITDPAVKPAANRILSDIDRYSSFVSAGQHHEQAKEYAAAASSYQSALEVNAHVSADDLAGKTMRMRQMPSASQSKSPAVVATNTPSKPPVADAKIAKQQAPELSPDEKKKRLLDESAQAMSRNDLDTAGRKYKQVLDIDPANEDAKRGIAAITTALSRDPVRLEKTLRDAITAYYASQFEDAESQLNRYLGADGGKKKGAAYFYLGATEATLGFLDDLSKQATRNRQAQEDFKQARSAGYEPVEKYVSTRVLAVWKGSGT